MDGHELAEPDSRASNSLRILLAEDNQINQKVTLLMLRKMGYKADVAINGLEALKSLERKPYDVILMDVQMPEMDGLEASRFIRRSFPAERQPKIIAITAYALDGDRERCLDAGMDGYLSKPVNIETLRDALSWKKIDAHISSRSQKDAQKSAPENTASH
jgi:CheY-like chemotaxis protein